MYGNINNEIIVDILYVLVAQSCSTLFALRDCSLPGSSVLGVSQSRILVWAPIPFSGGSF